MSANLPKQYVIDRIKAREGRLDILLVQDQELLDSMKAAQIADLDAIREANVKTILDFAEKVKEMDKDYDKAVTYDEKYKILNSMERSPSLRFSPSSYIQSDRERKLNGGRRTMADVQKDIRDQRQEQADLVHARLYLEEMPVSEFSMATMKNLGLISVLKFSLTDARAEAKAS